MADPKYAGLEGIAYDEPDVYETADLPESDQAQNFIEETNTIVERITISPNDAFNKFKGKAIDGQKVDFSDTLTSTPRPGYEINWELMEQGQKETLVQKAQRLQCELSELAEEVKQQEKSAKDGKQQESILVTGTQIDEALRKLADLKIAESLGEDLISSIVDPQGAQIKNLLAQLESFKKASVEAPEGQAQGEGVTFQLNYRPEKIKLQQTARVADLEMRLHRLESVLGTKGDKLTRLTSATEKSSLLESAQHLSATACLLAPKQLDHIEGRLTALAQKMDGLVKVKQEMAADVEKDKMIKELYDLVKDSENFAKVLPGTVERLQALEQLHNKSVEFASTLTQVEVLQAEIQGNVENNKALLKGVQESFAVNLDEINKTVIGLDARLKAFKKK